MSGTGNILLKRKVAGNSAAGIPAQGLPQAMPVLHLGGLARATFGGSGVPLETYSNRLWVGMSGYGGNSHNETGTTITQTSDDVNYSSTRPIWMGAEIRAHTPIANAVLKGNWDAPSDYVLVTQKSIKEWADATFQPLSGVQGISSNDLALLNEAGAAKGLQTFKSKTRIEQELQLNAYVDADNISHGATLTSLADDAFIFNETVSDISIGGEASVISIGNPGTNGCSVIIYDELTVEGELIAQLIDGGSF